MVVPLWRSRASLPVSHTSSLIFDVHQLSCRLTCRLNVFALSFSPFLFGVPCSGFVRRCRPPSMPACVALRGSPHSPKGILVLLCVNVFFWHFGIFSLPAAGLFSCSRLRGTQGARPDTGRKFGPWPRSVACALGVQIGKSPRGVIPST